MSHGGAVGFIGADVKIKIEEHEPPLTSDWHLVPTMDCKLEESVTVENRNQEAIYSADLLDFPDHLNHSLTIQKNVKEEPEDAEEKFDPLGSSRNEEKTGTKILTGGKSYKCEICEEFFDLSSSWKRHKLNHTGEILYQCSICGMSFSSSTSLNAHKDLHVTSISGSHGKSTRVEENTEGGEIFGHSAHSSVEKKHKCGICGESFQFQLELNLHRIVHKDKGHECIICGIRFDKPSCLNRHLNVHAGGKLYRCGVCSKCFSNRSKLREHRQCHTGKPCKCDVCGKYIKFKNFINHKKTHTGDKRHKCVSCGKCFLTSFHLKQHEVVHTGEKPFGCNICGTRFGQKSNLYSHEKRFHKITPN